MNKFTNKETFDEIFKSIDNITNENIKFMTASRKYYKIYPDEKPHKKQKNLKSNHIEILLNKHGKEKMLQMINLYDSPNHTVNFKNGIIRKKRERAAKLQDNIEEHKEE